MNQANGNLDNILDGIIDKSLQVDPKLICKVDDCDRLGSQYQYPQMDDDGEPTTVSLCDSHARREGFCFGCGGFFGGQEDFDRSDSPLCNDCHTAWNSDTDYYSGDDPMVDDQDLDY